MHNDNLVRLKRWHQYLFFQNLKLLYLIHLLLVFYILIILFLSEIRAPLPSILETSLSELPYHILEENYMVPTTEQLWLHSRFDNYIRYHQRQIRRCRVLSMKKKEKKLHFWHNTRRKKMNRLTHAILNFWLDVTARNIELTPNEIISCYWKLKSNYHW